MEKLYVKSITLQDFRGQNRVVNLFEKTSVRGANGVGKSSIMKAFFWLLTGMTDALSGKNHNLYDSRIELNEHTPIAMVSAIVNDGTRDIELKRTAKARFVRKKGNILPEKAPSDEYKYFIDSIEYNLTDFNAWIDNNICDHELLPYCLSGDFFTVLAEDDKKKARGVLEGLVGSVSISDVSIDMSRIKEDLDNYPLKSVVEKYKNLIKPLDLRLKEIPKQISDRMNEVNRQGDSISEIQRQIGELNAEIEKIDAANSESDKLMADAKAKRDEALARIDALNKDLVNIKVAYNNNIMRMQSERDAEISAVRERNRKIVSEYQEMQKAVENAKNNVAGLESVKKNISAKITELVKELDEWIKMEMPSENGLCKLCGQKLPADKYAEAVEKFNNEREERVKSIRNNISIEKKYYAEKEDEIEKNKKIAETEIADYVLEEEPKPLDIASVVPFESTPDCIKINRLISEITIPEISDNSGDSAIRRKELTDKINQLNIRLGAAQFEEQNKGKLKDEIEALKNEQKETAAKMAEYEGNIALCKEIEQECANILAERVNSHLNGCRIEMNEKQKNGELTPSCTILSGDGVKFSTLNNSARLLVSIEIQKLFCQLLGIQLPVFCDECSIYDSRHIPSGDGQYIYIHCSEDNTMQISEM